MKLGNKTFFTFFVSLFFGSHLLIAQDNITTTPLINLNELKPSFEEEEESSNEKTDNSIILNKKKIKKNDNFSNAKFIGLDKITAKTSELVINLGETQKFGPLEIKVLKCGKLKSEFQNESVAYIQVKDLSENENEKVFIFNGWTFSSDPTIAPFDHAIYDLQLVQCNNV